MNPFDLLAPDRWPIFVLITARVVGVMMVAPLWSMSAIPRNVRVGLALVLSAALMPIGSAAATDVFRVGYLPLQMGAELLLGMVIGLAASLFVHGVAIAGEIVSVQMGLAIAAALAPGVGFSGPGVGTIKNLLVLGTYLTFGGHLILIGGMAESVRVIPPGVPLALGSGAPGLTALIGTVFVSAVKVAAPLMAAMMLANTVMGILSKAVPQINTLMVAFPITIWLGLVVLLATLPVLAGVARNWVLGLPGALDGVIQLLTPTAPLPVGS